MNKIFVVVIVYNTNFHFQFKIIIEKKWELITLCVVDL